MLYCCLLYGLSSDNRVVAHSAGAQPYTTNYTLQPAHISTEKSSLPIASSTQVTALNTHVLPWTLRSRWLWCHILICCVCSSDRLVFVAVSFLNMYWMKYQLVVVHHFYVAMYWSYSYLPSSSIWDILFSEYAWGGSPCRILRIGFELFCWLCQKTNFHFVLGSEDFSTVKTYCQNVSSMRPQWSMSFVHHFWLVGDFSWQEVVSALCLRPEGRHAGR